MSIPAAAAHGTLAALALPSPPSWYPGHMRQFVRALPALLTRTDVVLELRDARLPLTSINAAFEDVLRKWRHERRNLSAALASPSSSTPSLKGNSSTVCERIIVLNKRDLVPEWGIEPFRRAMTTKHPDQKVIFASWNRPRDVKNLHELIVNIARDNKHIANEINVLVVGMPNVGKSTLLNALRNMGIPGPTPKALRTSAHPGLTRALSTRLKLAEATSAHPKVYSFDSPGVMLPFLGKGELGAERGMKLALIAGIREGLYSEESLAAYLLYRLNIMNPIRPAYLSLLPPGTPPTDDLETFLDLLARRLGMLKRGGTRDVERAAVWLVKWWREEGCSLTALAPDPDWYGGVLSSAPDDRASDSPEALKQSADQVMPGSHLRHGGWGFDFEWELTPRELNLASSQDARASAIQSAMERAIDDYARRIDKEMRAMEGMSKTQEKKREKEEQKIRRAKRVAAMLAVRRAGGAR